jgi:hypothetical protein
VCYPPSGLGAMGCVSGAGEGVACSGCMGIAWVLGDLGRWVQGCGRRVQGRVLRAADKRELGDMCGVCWVQGDRYRLLGVSRNPLHVGYGLGLFWLLGGVGCWGRFSGCVGGGGVVNAGCVLIPA